MIKSKINRKYIFKHTAMLTKRQKQVLDFIKSFKEKREYAPSLEEIKKHLRLSSVSTAHYHILKLEKEGYIKKEKNEPRAIELRTEEKDKLVEIPLVGQIAAGEPIEAIEDIEIIKVLKSQLPKSGEHYALRVRGNSMVDEGIFDGDIVIIRKQQTADNGQTVIAIIDDNEATLKRLYKEKRRIKLQPANQMLLPFYRKEVEIRGIVVKIIRDLEKKASKNDFSKLSAEIFEEKKKTFLASITSANPNSRNKYKRVVETPIRYAGGKSLAVGYVVELLPKNIRRLVSPFFGGGSVEIACNKYLDLEVVGFEIFDILVNYWNIQIQNPKELFRKLSLLKPDKETYRILKEKLKAHWENKIKLPSLDLAAYYYFNHNISYGPGFLGWPSKIYLNGKRYKTMLEKVRNFSVKNVEVKCASFEEVFKKYPNDFFYCDPPYFLGKDTKMFIGIYPMRNFPVHHNGFDHKKLRDLLKQHKGGFILSYNNCKTIRDWYGEYEHYFPKWQYTMGQGETRIGKNRKNTNSTHVKESHEVLIFGPPKSK